MKSRILLAIANLLLAIILPPLAGAQENLTLDIQVGFDSFYKVDAWTPVRVTVTNQGAALQAELRLRDDNAGYGVSNIVYVYPVDLPAGSRKQFVLSVPLRGQRQLNVELADSTGVVLAQRSHIQALGENDFLVGVVASDPSLLNSLAGLNMSANGRVAVAHLKPDDLPTPLQAWSGLDMLVFNDVDTTRLTPTQQDALNNWVRRGGRLVVGGGPNALQTIAGLTTLLPFSRVTLQTLPHPLIAIQKLVSTPLDDRGPYVAAVPTGAGGQILVREGNLDVITVVERGQGRVYYLAFDLGLAPLDQLAGDPQFFPRLMGPFQPHQQQLTNRNIADNIRRSLALIPGQTLPSPKTLTLYLVVYILVMGPANYFILSRLNRREWAWFTIPIIILIFTGSGYFSGFRMRGGRPLVRQIAVLRAEAGAALASLDSYVGIYSPFRTAYTLEIDSNTTLVESLPNPDSVNNELTVTTSDSTVIKDLRGDIGGMPGIVAHSHTEPPKIRANLSYNRANNFMAGRIINNTGRPITDAQLVMGNRVLALGSLQPGEMQLDGTFSQLDPYRFYLNIDTINSPEANIKLASRDEAIRTVLGLNNLGYVSLNFSGVYLVGWQEDSPLRVELTNMPSDRLDETLLVVEVPFVAY